MRIARQRPKGHLPAGTEELRQKLVSKPMLGSLKPNFEAFTDYICLGPSAIPWRSLVRLVKNVLSNHNGPFCSSMSLSSQGGVKKAHRENVPLKDTLEQVCENCELKELYFTSPAALSAQTFVSLLPKFPAQT